MPSRVRANGSMLPQLVDQDVCLRGKVVRVDPSKRNFVLLCSDNVEVRISFPSFIQVGVENAIVEVMGVANDPQGKLFSATNLIVFSEDMCTKYNPEQYNKAITLIQQYPQFYFRK